MSTSCRRRAFAFAVLSALVAPAARAQLEPRIVNGLMTTDYAAVGALLRGTDPGSAVSQCSGTLIGCSTFLTAAHCVCAGTGAGCQPPNAPDPGGYQVYLPHGGLFAVSSITVRPDYAYPVGDLAIVNLAKPVNGIRPSEINTTAAPPFGTSGTIVGFGRSGGSSWDYGLERYGAVTTGECPLLVSPTTSLCWTFDAAIGPPGTDSNTCNADSGGPLFVDFGAGPRVAGVTSGGTSTDCLPTDQSFDANVFPYRSWVLSTGGTDLDPASCGALPPVGDAATTSLDLSGTVSAAAPESRSSFEVAAGTTLLRVAMNAVDDGTANFDLYVKQGAPPTPTSYDCARTGAGQYGVCDLAAPSAGTWHALVRRVTGGGTAQVTVTRFGASNLGVGLASSLGAIAPGETFPLTLSLDNRTDAPQRLALLAMLVTPDGGTIPLIPARGVSLAQGQHVDATLALPVPLAAPRGTWTVGTVLWQAGAGVLDQAVLSFEVR